MSVCKKLNSSHFKMCLSFVFTSQASDKTQGSSFQTETELSSSFSLQSEQCGGPAGGGWQIPPTHSAGVSANPERLVSDKNLLFSAAAQSQSRLRSSPVGWSLLQGCHTASHRKKPPWMRNKDSGAKNIWAAAQSDNSCQAATESGRLWNLRG